MHVAFFCHVYQCVRWPGFSHNLSVQQEKVTTEEIIHCSEHIRGSLVHLSGALGIPDEKLQEIKSSFKETPSLQLLKLWQTSDPSGGRRSELTQILRATGFVKAAEKYVLYVSLCLLIQL